MFSHTVSTQILIDNLFWGVLGIELRIDDLICARHCAIPGGARMMNKRDIFKEWMGIGEYSMREKM